VAGTRAVHARAGCMPGLQRRPPTSAGPGPQGLRGRLMQLYAARPDAEGAPGAAGARGRRVMFALAFFHCVMLERRRFPSPGGGARSALYDADYLVRIAGRVSGARSRRLAAALARGAGLACGLRYSEISLSCTA